MSNSQGIYGTIQEGVPKWAWSNTLLSDILAPSQVYYRDTLRVFMPTYSLVSQMSRYKQLQDQTTVCLDLIFTIKYQSRPLYMDIMESFAESCQHISLFMFHLKVKSNFMIHNKPLHRKANTSAILIFLWYFHYPPNAFILGDVRRK